MMSKTSLFNIKIIFF